MASTKKTSGKNPDTKFENRVASAIAAWIEATWNDQDWGGAPKEIPGRIRSGEWRGAAVGKAAE